MPPTEQQDTSAKALAQKLAKYAFNPTSPSPLSSPKALRPRDVHPIIAAHSAVAGPSTPVALTPLVERTTPRKRKAPSADGTDPSEASRGSPSSAASTPIKRRPRPFAGPEVYAHLKPVTDHLGPDLKIIFCGINPGKMSSTLGHHFAHPTNKFWKSLHQSGITDRLVSPAEDHSMPEAYDFGLTNLCGRPTAEQSELSPLEMKLSVSGLTLKILANRPNVVCFVGKKIWDVYESVVAKSAGSPVSNATDVPLPYASTSGPGIAMEASVKEERTELGETSPADSVPVTVDAHPLHHPVKLERPDSPLEDAEMSVSPREAKSSRARRVNPGKRGDTPSGSYRHPTKAAARHKPPPIDWTQPRQFRLPHDKGYTYFWVTPSTSGLERTPFAEQVQIFSHLRAFAEVVKGEKSVPGTYRDIDVQGVIETVEALRASAIAKGKIVA